MAILREPEENKTITDPQEITERLSSIDIDYEEWEPSQPVTAGSSTEEILQVYPKQVNLLKVPRGTHHWFDLGAERVIRAIRPFQDSAGWTPHYTESSLDRSFEPVSFGPRYIKPLFATAL